MIIPVYKPDGKLIKIIEKLRKQTVKPAGINLVWSKTDHEEDAVMSRIKRECGDIRILEIPVREFDHGGTRRRAVRNTPCDIFVMMTQDAVPKNDMLIENLTAPLISQMRAEEDACENMPWVAPGDGDDPDDVGLGEDKAEENSGRTPNGTVIACVYGRQLPGRDSSPYEKLSRLHNYSELSRTKTGEDIKKLGIKAFFCSDVCCAYRRDIYEECGGFVRYCEMKISWSNLVWTRYSSICCGRWSLCFLPEMGLMMNRIFSLLMEVVCCGFQIVGNHPVVVHL